MSDGDWDEYWYDAAYDDECAQRNTHLTPDQRELFKECNDGNEDTVMRLIAKGTGLNVQDSNGRTPLYGVC